MDFTDANALALVCAATSFDHADTLRQQLREERRRRVEERARHEAELAAIWQRVCEVASDLQTSGGAREDVKVLARMRDDTYRLALSGDAHVGQEVEVVTEMWCEYENFAPRVVDKERVVGRIVKVVQRPPSIHYVCVRIDEKLMLEFDMTTIMEPRASNIGRDQ